MKFATISTHHATSQPALVKDDRSTPCPIPTCSRSSPRVPKEAASKASKDSLSIDEVRFLSPLTPNTLRDGYAFEQHVKTANKNRGREVPEEWYQFPVFYFTNPNAVFGHDDVISYPPYTNALDYETGSRGSDWQRRNKYKT